MIQVHKIKKWVYSFESQEQLTKVLFIGNKIWMNEKEIAKLFNIKKNKVNNIISKIFLEWEYSLHSNIITSFNETTKKQKSYYSLEVILSIGYRLKSFEETKFIITGNRILKENKNTDSSKLTVFQNSIKNVSKIFKMLQLG
jgi:hypothetical protein